MPAPGFFYCSHASGVFAPQLDQVRIAAPFRAHTGLQIDLLRALQRQPRRSAMQAALLPCSSPIRASSTAPQRMAYIFDSPPWFCSPKSLWIA